MCVCLKGRSIASVSTAIVIVAIAAAAALQALFNPSQRWNNYSKTPSSVWSDLLSWLFSYPSRQADLEELQPKPQNEVSLEPHYMNNALM